MDAELVFVGEYRHPEEHEQRPDIAFLFLALRGLLHYQDRAGEELSPGPMLSLILPGESFRFTFGEDRLNWVVGFRCPSLTSLPDGRVAMPGGRGDISFPARRWVAPDEVMRLTEECLAMQGLLAQPTPASLCRADFGITVFLQVMLTPSPELEDECPAARLKALLDDPDCRSVSIAALSRRCGRSVEHLRSLFRGRYQLSPKRYRQRQVMAQAMEMVAHTSLSVKEMARALGYRYASHFSGQFRSQMGISPQEAIGRYRTARGG
ncbi:MAG: helix-turn-helix domain-containing protein [Planctomycetota bacterium]|jgi:AraC-like DNA-binding protein